MGRKRIKVSRLDEKIIRAIDLHCFGAKTAFWKRYLSGGDISQSQFSSAMRQDQIEEWVKNAIIAVLPVAALEESFSDILIRKCPHCGEMISATATIVGGNDNQGNHHEYRNVK